MVKSEPKKKPQSGGFFQKFFRKPEKSQKEQWLTVQRSIPYLEMGRDGICRVEEHLYSKTVRFYDINYQLAQNEDKNTIFESWCDFLNYFDASIRFQLSFINHKSDMSEYNKVIQIEPQHDQFDDVRMEYAQMLRQQLAKGNNGLVRTKYITFSIEAKSVREAKPRLERIETDILNNFKVLGVKAYPLNGVERLQIMYETFHQEEQQKFDFSYDRILQSGMTTKDFIAPTSFLFKSGKDFMMGDTYGAASYLNILAPELTDKVLAEFLDMDKNLVVSIHVQSVDQLKAIKLIKGKITDLDRMKIEEQKKAVRSGYDMEIIPSDLATYGGEAKKILDDLQSRNERILQCRNGIDTIVEDYKTVPGWDNPYIQNHVVQPLQGALAVQDVELAYELPDAYFHIQTCEDGFDYTLYNKDFTERDGGVLETDGDKSVQEAMTELLAAFSCDAAEGKVMDAAELREQADTVAEQQAEVLKEKLAAERPAPEETLSFYVAECLEFTFAGEFHDHLTMEEALEVYDKIPSERMNADKCIGFCIEEDGGFVGMYELVVNDKVQRENINSINYFRDDQLVQQAISDMEKLMEARQKSKEQERSSTKKSVLDALRSLKTKKQEQPAQDKPKKAKKKGMEL